MRYIERLLLKIYQIRDLNWDQEINLAEGITQNIDVYSQRYEQFIEPANRIRGSTFKFL